MISYCRMTSLALLSTSRASLHTITTSSSSCSRDSAAPSLRTTCYTMQLWNILSNYHRQNAFFIQRFITHVYEVGIAVGPSCQAVLGAIESLHEFQSRLRLTMSAIPSPQCQRLVVMPIWLKRVFIRFRFRNAGDTY